MWWRMTYQSLYGEWQDLFTIDGRTSKQSEWNYAYHEDWLERWISSTRNGNWACEIHCVQNQVCSLGISGYVFCINQCTSNILERHELNTLTTYRIGPGNRHKGRNKLRWRNGGSNIHQQYINTYKWITSKTSPTCCIGVCLITRRWYVSQNWQIHIQCRGSIILGMCSLWKNQPHRSRKSITYCGLAPTNLAARSTKTA